MEELANLAIAALVGFLIGYFTKRSNLDKETKELNQEITSLLNDVRIDLEEARIERNALSEQQSIILKQLKIYEGHYQSVMKKEERKQQADKRAEKRAKTTEGKIGNLKRDNDID